MQIDTKPGIFIVYEGGEGTGKSTQISRLHDSLARNGHDVVATRDPGGSPGATDIRALVVSGEINRWTPETEMLLYTAARADLVARVIRPALDAGKTVLCDRFVDSTYAYQGRGGIAENAMIAALHRDFCGDIQADLTIILDADVKETLARSKSRLAAEKSNEDRFEKMDIAFHERLRELYLARAAAYPARYLVVDASRSLDEIAAEIFARVARLEHRQSTRAA